MPPLNVTAANLPQQDSFSARWSAWVIGIWTVDNAWHVRVWPWAHGARVQIAKRAVLSTSGDAVAWACEVLRKHGAPVFDGPEQQLEAFLSFEPDDAPRRRLT